MENLTKRFFKYVKIDTQSDHRSKTFPSTEKQKDLSLVLVSELKEMGLAAFLDDFGYVYAKINKNASNAYSIGFIAHVDTSPDAPGANVNPRIVKKYDGSLIQLNKSISMDPSRFESLQRVIGDDIIVTDGNTLLGADNKCGVAEIMELAHYYTSYPDVLHGDIYICFTPDEEIGKGADHFDYDYFKADFAYTVDGSEVGGIEFQNFNAASADLTFIGQSIHPGSAKNKLINALNIAMEFDTMLPLHKDPSLTEDYEGFNHLTNLSGGVEKATSHYIIRDHSMNVFNENKNEFVLIKDYLNKKYGYEAVLLSITDSYFNMYEILKDHMYIVDLAKKAINNVGLDPQTNPVRGGTDGSRLTYGGLLCPNLGTGGYHFHGRLEFASIQQMEKAVKVLIEIVKLGVSK